jgi:alpha-1,2-glucosyltransferase
MDGGDGGSRREKTEHSSSHRLPLLLLWWLCSAVVLVPSQLLEFRYFTVPTLIAFLMLTVDGREDGKEGGDGMRRTRMTAAAAVAVVVGWAVVDIITVWVFLNKPFIWGDGSIARFVW